MKPQYHSFPASFLSMLNLWCMLFAFANWYPTASVALGWRQTTYLPLSSCVRLVPFPALNHVLTRLCTCSAAIVYAPLPEVCLMMFTAPLCVCRLNWDTCARRGILSVHEKARIVLSSNVIVNKNRRRAVFSGRRWVDKGALSRYVLFMLNMETYIAQDNWSDHELNVMMVWFRAERIPIWPFSQSGSRGWERLSVIYIFVHRCKNDGVKQKNWKRKHDKMIKKRL